MGAAVVALALMGAYCVWRGHTIAAVCMFATIAAMVPVWRAWELWADRRRERDWRAGKRCAHCDASVETACADCRMDLGVTVYVCGHSVCRDMHELAAGCESSERAS